MARRRRRLSRNWARESRARRPLRPGAETCLHQPLRTILTRIYAAGDTIQAFGITGTLERREGLVLLSADEAARGVKLNLL